MNGWSAKDVTLTTAGTAYAGVLANQPITCEFPITAGGSLNCVLKVKASAATVAGSITAKLQTAIGNDWVDSKTVAITASGSFYIKLNVEVTADQTFLPLLNKGRVVVTNTNAGDTSTITSVEILQEL